jgi:hypothetical protein
MGKQELYKEMGMDEFYWGDCFIIDRNENDSDTIRCIDTVCIVEGRHALADKWNELSFSECSELLLNAFNFDLAYQSCAIMPTEKAAYYRNFLVSKFKDTDTKCFTNWFQNPWKSKHGASWNPITDNTFDMVIVLADATKIAFTLFISED